MTRLTCLLLLATTVPALAQPVVHEADRVVVKKRTIVEFSEASVEAGILKPEGSYFTPPRRPGFENRISVRANFNPELQRSTDSL